MVAATAKALQKRKAKGIRKISKKKLVKHSITKVQDVSDCKTHEVKETLIARSIKKRVKYIYPSKAVTESLINLTLNTLSKLTENYNIKNMIFGDENPIFMQIRCIKIQNTTGNIKL